jgi:hypothetical protein
MSLKNSLSKPFLLLLFPPFSGDVCSDVAVAPGGGGGGGAGGGGGDGGVVVPVGVVVVPVGGGISVGSVLFPLRFLFLGGLGSAVVGPASFAAPADFCFAR